ncbi:MAG: surface carbohydrate biosynthesis protein [Myxococcota bacterium]
MKPQSLSLIVPVENQVRELDPKLLVACAAAERGFRVFLGSRTRVDFRIASFPRGIYLSKGMTPKSGKMFRIMRSLGHEIAALDEEGLVYHSAEEYYARRVSNATLELIATLFAWGEESAALLRAHPQYPGTPLYATGNPRIDLLRPELRAYFEDETSRIRERLGRFILINTNFSKVNAYFPRMNLLAPPAREGDLPELGATGIGLPREFAEGLAAHKGVLFDHFRSMIPAVHDAFPNHQIVVRPHPSENREPWNLVVKDLLRAHVIHEGNVIPWLASSELLIHNGCTTGIEAFVMQKPSVCYRPVTADVFDLELPNALSQQCFGLDALQSTLREVLHDGAGCRHSDEQRLLIDRHLSGREGALATDRIVDVLTARAHAGEQRRSGAAEYLRGWLAAHQRSLVKRHIKARIPQHRNNPDYQRNRYEGIGQEELGRRIERLGTCLGRFAGLRVAPVAEHIYEIGF